MPRLVAAPATPRSAFRDNQNALCRRDARRDGAFEPARACCGDIATREVQAPRQGLRRWPLARAGSLRSPDCAQPLCRPAKGCQPVAHIAIFITSCCRSQNEKAGNDVYWAVSAGKRSGGPRKSFVACPALPGRNLTGKKRRTTKGGRPQPGHLHQHRDQECGRAPDVCAIRTAACEGS